MTAAATNGKAPARKQLSDQLDRLDKIIDALADGLNQAVADACREGARAAVREVILELIANPDLLVAVRATATPVTPVVSVEEPPSSKPDAPSIWNRVKSTAKSAGRAVIGAARTLTKAVERTIKPATEVLKLTGTTQKVVAVALGVGLATGALSLICPTWMTAVLTAGIGAAAVCAAHIGATMNAIVARFRTE